MGKKSFLLFLIISAAAFLSGCVSSKLPAGEWSLIDYTVNESQQVICPATLVIKENLEGNPEVTGFSGVNTYSGVYLFEEDKLMLKGNLAVTRMAGPKSVLSFEESYLSALRNAESWSLETKNGLQVLEIKCPEENSSLRFVRYTLLGKNWKVMALGENSPAVSVSNQPEISFQNSGIASCYTGLNYCISRVRIDADRHEISFSDGAITLMDGTDPESLVEQSFMDAVYAAKFYSFDGKILTLHNEEGQRVMTLKEAD